MSSEVAHWLGILSVGSGALCLDLPGPMAKAYGLPRSASLLGWIGLRDLAVGAMLVNRHLGVGLPLRASSDILDSVLISVEARRSHRRLWRTAVRLMIAVSSAAFALAARRRPS